MAHAPDKNDIPPAHLDAARRICLDFPDAHEEETWGHPTFRVRSKIFAGMGRDDDGRVTMSMKAAAGEQASLIATGHPFFMPKYVGSKGWVGVVIDDATDWEEIAELIDDSYRAIAPGTLVKQLDND